MIKLVAFDLWLTLAYKNVEYSASEKIIKKLKIDIPKEEFVSIFEEALQTRTWNSEYEAYRGVCIALGLKPTDENVNTFIRMRDKVESECMLFDHTIPLLEELRRNGYKTGLVSNCSQFAAERIKKRTELLDYIDYPFFSYAVGFVKPDIRFFGKMLEITGCKPDETVMVGDTKKNDVIVPKSIGMNAIHFRNYLQLRKDLKTLGVKIE
jgi:HAD superfamily hydrolase (TIGR01549 family)